MLPPTKLSVSITTEKSKSAGLSKMTTFLSGLLRFGADAGVNCENSDKTSFTCDRIGTKQFISNKEYLQRCVDNEAVRDHVKR